MGGIVNEIIYASHTDIGEDRVAPLETNKRTWESRMQRSVPTR